MTSQTPPPVSGVTPHIHPSNASDAAEFYKKAFAAEEAMRMPADDGKRLMHCHLIINGGPLFLADCFPEYGYPHQNAQGYTLHLQVDDPQAWWDRAVSAGAEIAEPMQKQFWGDRYGLLKDPFGIRWSIGGPDTE